MSTFTNSSPFRTSKKPLLIFLMVVVAAGAPVRASTSEVTLKHLYTIEAGRSNPRLIAPVAVFFDSKRQELHVADAGTSVVTTFARGANAVGHFHHRQKGSDQNGEPAGLAVDGSGNIIVSDALVDRVFVYDYRGEPTRYIQMPQADGDRLMPGKLALDGAGNLYVAIRNTGVVLVFGPDGALKRRVDATQFGVAECCDVAVDAAANTWLLSPKGTAVHKFDAQGKHARQFGSHVVGKAGFAHPVALDVDGSGRVWVGDTVMHTVKLFLADGTFLTEFGGPGEGKGSFFSPTDLCIDRAAKTLFVLEKNGQRIQAFAIVDSTSGRSDQHDAK